MRTLSPLFTIASAANVSTSPNPAGGTAIAGADIGHQRVVGLLMVTKGDFTDTDMVVVQQLVSGNLGQGNEVWGTTNIVTLAGVATALGVTGAEWEAAATNSVFLFQDNLDGILTLPVVRLALVVPATGAAGTNAAAQVQARLILESHR